MPSFEEKVSAFDLPNLRRQPTFQVLQETIQSLQLKPTSWEQTTHSNNSSEEAGISRYLTSLISSAFEWFDGTEEGDLDAKREVLWDLASKRVTERCGRSAMGELNRTWTIPSSEKLPSLSFEIREPPLTGDNLGFKTWGTAFAISKKLEYIGTHILKDVLPFDLAKDSPATVLELGSGTGLVGIAAAAIWSTSILLTDLPEIQSNLDFNIQANVGTVMAGGGQVTSHVLDWKSDEGLIGYPTQTFDIIIAADSIYDNDHPNLISNMIKKHLKQEFNSRALVAVPLRDKNTVRIVGDFRKQLESFGFKMLHEGREVCTDDWEGKADEEGVKCWWAIFAPSKGVRDQGRL